MPVRRLRSRDADRTGRTSAADRAPIEVITRALSLASGPGVADLTDEDALGVYWRLLVSALRVSRVWSAAARPALQAMLPSGRIAMAWAGAMRARGTMGVCGRRIRALRLDAPRESMHAATMEAYGEIAAACGNVRIARVGELRAITDGRTSYPSLRRLQIDEGSLSDLVRMPRCALEWLSLGEARTWDTGPRPILPRAGRLDRLKTLRLVGRHNQRLDEYMGDMPALTTLELLDDRPAGRFVMSSDTSTLPTITHVRVRVANMAGPAFQRTLAALPGMVELVIEEGNKTRLAGSIDMLVDQLDYRLGAIAGPLALRIITLRFRFSLTDADEAVIEALRRRCALRGIVVDVQAVAHGL